MSRAVHFLPMLELIIQIQLCRTLFSSTELSYFLLLKISVNNRYKLNAEKSVSIHNTGQRFVNKEHFWRSCRFTSDDRAQLLPANSTAFKKSDQAN